MKIGIIGQGYVGSAIKIGFEPYYELETYDKYDVDKSSCSLEKLVESCKVIFVCVPTPMNKNGSCNTDIVEGVVDDINKLSSKEKIVVIKSTISPGTTDRLNKKYKKISVIFNPEFLTEANFIEDFKNQTRIILGGTRKGTNKLRQIYSKVFPKSHIIKTGSKTAEMVKYMTNTYLATKVSFFNEIEDFCRRKSINYENVRHLVAQDKRIGHSHTYVPGPDGKRGFGGTCFPKDVSSLITQMIDVGLLSYVLIAARNRNIDIDRPEKDWSEDKGRAVI